MTSFDLALRPAGPDDAAVLSSFAEHIFRDTFGPHNRPDDMDLYCSAAFSIDQQREQILDPDYYIVLAIMGGELAGYAQLHVGPPPACVAGPHPIELKRLYVDRRWQGGGVAQALMHHAIEVARQRGARTLYLAVWRHNHRAIAFYRKYGFEEVGTAEFLLGTDLQVDPVMVRPLSVATAGAEIASLVEPGR
jgi:ribosomal protein S18 acetylase RimI-like enzyme